MDLQWELQLQNKNDRSIGNLRLSRNSDRLTNAYIAFSKWPFVVFVSCFDITNLEMSKNIARSTCTCDADLILQTNSVDRCMLSCQLYEGKQCSFIFFGIICIDMIFIRIQLLIFFCQLRIRFVIFSDTIDANIRDSVICGCYI